MLSSEELNIMFRISIREDNVESMSDARNPRVSGLSEHVDLKYKFLIDDTTKGEDHVHGGPIR